MKRLSTIVGLLVAFAAQSASGSVIESINEGIAPNTGAPWNAWDVGWVYTPSSSYLLTGITTRFARADGRNSTLAVYSAPPVDGGVLLRSAVFTPLADVYSGGTFEALHLNKDTSYFFGFINVDGLGVNVTYQPDQQVLNPGIYYSFGGTLSRARFDTGPQLSVHAQPIVRFIGDAEVPEPPTVALFALAALSAGYAYRRRS
jgi:hypothetical protein